MRLALIGMLLLACAGTPEDATPLPVIASVLVAPVGVRERAPQQVEAGAAVLDEVIARVLWEKDLRVQAAPAEQFRADWKQAQQQVDSAAGGDAQPEAARFDAAAAAVVAAWRARGTEFDALLIPYLVNRDGTVVGESVQWDGVVRQLPVEYEYHDKAHVEARRRLSTRCTSLRMLVFAADGRRLFERYGGLETTQTMKIAEGNWSWTERGDLFRDRADLEDGARVALKPLLRRD